MGVAIYLTPDGKHAISGYMYDEKGNNLSEQLFQKELYTPAGQAMWKKLESADWLRKVKKRRPSSFMCLPTLSAPTVNSSGNRRGRGLNPVKCNYAHYWSA